MMEQKKFSKETCIVLLQEKQNVISANNEVRFPKRADFSEAEVVAIKAFLGPWPRALEAAGLKEPRAEDRKQQNREKRLRAKLRRKNAENKKGE